MRKIGLATNHNQYKHSVARKPLLDCFFKTAFYERMVRSTTTVEPYLERAQKELSKGVWAQQETQWRSSSKVAKRSMKIPQIL